MTDDATQNSKPELRADLLPWLDAWKTCAQNVISQTSGQPQPFELTSEPFAPADSDSRYTVVVAGALLGEMSLRLHQASGVWLARKFLGEIGAPTAAGAAPSEPISNDDAEALEELLRQISGLAATAIGAAVGGEVKLQLARAQVPWSWSAEAVASLRTADEPGREIAIELGISPALAVAIAARNAAAAASASAPVSVSTPVAASVPAAVSEPVAPPTHATGYQRLFEVGLGVKLRFGTRRMLLRDVLALSSGLVVELDNALNSPVDLLLDGRIIARGEVVVIDGKYGLRVTGVVDPAPAGAARPA
ncbi:MAG: FliM/FliN family flagellar motor switch protein [Terriglobales bacterium]